MPSTVEDLLEVLTLEQVEDDIFRGRSPRTSLQRVFGGQVLGQALMAGGRSVPTDRRVHSLHGYFLRLGDPEVPIAYVVERVRDGGSFSTRRVVARQHGRPIFHMSASFQVEEPGLEHQDLAPLAPPPDGLPNLVERAELGRPSFPEPKDWAAIDVRPVDPSAEAMAEAMAERGTPSGPGGHLAPGLRVWLRAAGPLPDDPLLHAAVLAYASDMTLLAVAATPHDIALSDQRLFTASIDHAMWFHRSFRADEFLLHDQISPSASGGRGTGQGRVFDLGGRLVATTVQEGLMRLRDPGLVAP